MGQIDSWQACLFSRIRMAAVEGLRQYTSNGTTYLIKQKHMALKNRTGNRSKLEGNRQKSTNPIRVEIKRPHAVLAYY